MSRRVIALNIIITININAIYRRIVQKAFLLGLFSGELTFSEGLVIGRNFAFQNGFSLSIKTTKNTKITA